MAGTEPQARIAMLDIVRGVAVMGILAMNIVAFSMPLEAYLNPAAYGLETMADFIAWVVSFIFVDGKMRGLFSFLFGASLLLVVERADASGRSGGRTHFWRMAWLAVFGLLHYYLVWYGDILFLYAVVGLVAWLFRAKDSETLVKASFWLIAAQFVLMALFAWSLAKAEAAAALPGADAQAVTRWTAMQGDFAVPSAAALAETLALYRGDYASIVAHRYHDQGNGPFISIAFTGAETLAYMLLGMAGLKSGFLKGEWSELAYRRVLLIGFAIGAPAYAVMAWLLVTSGYNVSMIVATTMAASVIFRPAMIYAYVALIILAVRGGGWLVERIAAAGRAAFTNYLGTSILMTSLFYGYGIGLYGTMGRAQVWLVVVTMWALMLIWSKPWLDRYRYGPFEWLWRTLAQGRLQPMRKVATAP